MYGDLKRVVWLVLVVGALTLAGCCGMQCKEQRRMKCENCQMKGMQGGGKMAAPMAADQAQRRDLLYVCNCGPECKCNTVATAPGNCKCGKPMAAYHVVKIEGDEALLCTCGANCTCAIDPKDATRCGCGKEVKRVSLKGTGIFFCNCGGSCACNTVSATPLACKCGMELKKAE